MRSTSCKVALLLAVALMISFSAAYLLKSRRSLSLETRRSTLSESNQQDDLLNRPTSDESLFSKATPGQRAIRRATRATGSEKASPELIEKAVRKLQAYDQPGEAAEFYRQKRLPEGETEIPVERYFAAREHMRLMPQYSTALNRLLPPQAEMKAAEAESATWTPLGPGNIGGRTRSLLINPVDTQVMYAAGVAGGVWKSVNGGASWTPLADMLPNLAVNSMAMDPRNPNVIYAGTGEGFFNSDAVRGAGIFKTTDGGATWTRLENTTGQDFYYVNDIAISPANSQRVYAATRTGVWRSLDGGATWARTLDGRRNDNGPEDVGCLDLAIRTDRATDFLFGSCGSFRNSTIHRNVDAGGAGVWETVLSEDGGRTSLAIAPSDQNVIYALSAFRFNGSPNSYSLYAVYRSTNGGDSGSWTARARYDGGNKLNAALLSNPLAAFFDVCGYGPARLSHQGWYDNVIAVDPNDANRVWAGGIDLFRSDDGGANWGLASYWWADPADPRYAHADHHAIVFHPGFDGTTNKTMFVAGDGGVIRTLDARASVATKVSDACNPGATQMSWASINNNYGVTQFYHGGVFPDGKTYFGGTQDNGTLRGSDDSGANKWREIFGGDGGYVAVNPDSPNEIYVETTRLSLRKSTDGGQTFGSAVSGAAGSTLFITPFAMDPSDPQRLWLGGTFRPQRSRNGAGSWQQAGADFATQGIISALAVAPTNANFVLAGTTTGHIHRTDSGLISNKQTVWLSAQPRDGYASWVAFDPANPNIAYATYSTFGGGAHVWRSADAGMSWTPIDGAGTGALPDIPVHCIVIDPANTAQIFIGTDLGVFVSTNGGASWAVEQTGFPSTVVESLTLNTVGGVTSLYAFTHGRGAWRVAVSNSGCGFRLSSSGAFFAAAGGVGGANVTVEPNVCAWTAMSNATWITVRGGMVSGTVSFDVAANPGGSVRIGVITIAGRSFTVTQAGVVDVTAPTVSITAPSATGLFRTSQGGVDLAGSAADDVGLSQIAWVNDRGGSGVASGTAQWSINGVKLSGGINQITVTARDTSGNERTASVAVIFNPPEVITTIAGNGTAGFSGDGGPATAAQLNEAFDVAVDQNGNVYFSDLINRRVRRVTPAGIISTLAGNGSVGSGGDGGPATAAQLQFPAGVGVDRDGNVYVADFNGNLVRKINVATGIITTVPGTTQIFKPADVAVDNSGILYVTSWGLNRVFKVTPDGTVSVFAGTGEPFSPIGDGGPATQANMLEPRGIAVDSAGNVYIAQERSHRIRKVTPSGMITTVAGNGGETLVVGDGGPANRAFINTPYGVALDSAGNLYIAEYRGYRVRKVNAGGTITTVAGTGERGFGGDGGPGNAARITPAGIAVDSAGQLYIADDFNNRIRKLSFSSGEDNVMPVLAITTPTASPSYTALQPTLRLGGTALDNSSITHVSWSSDRVSGGVANGTNAWAFDLALRPGVNNITVTAWDASGNSSSAKLAVTFAAPNVAITIAGSGLTSFGETSREGPLRLPETVAFDKAGNLFIVDSGNHVVRKMTRDGRINVFAGNGQVGSGGDGGAAISASLNSPSGIAIDAAGNVYISDTNNHRIRKVAPNGIITTVAGTGVGGFNGDGGPATAAKLDTPIGLAIDLNGDLIIADTGNHRLRKLRPSAGIISAFVGGFGSSPNNVPASEVRFNFPTSVAVDRENNIYVSDTGNHQVRKLTSSGGTTIVISGPGFRGDGGPAIEANVTAPGGLTLDEAGNLYIADQGNHRIRKLAGGIINTVAGAEHVGQSTANDNGGVATSLWLNNPAGVAIDPAGNLFVADTGNHRIVAVTSFRNVASVSAASFIGPVAASEQIVAAFGNDLATKTEIAASTPLPTQLAGTSVRVRDGAGNERPAPLFFVSPGQVNYLIPAGTTAGAATVTIINGDGVISTGGLAINSVAPSLFSANSNGQGVAAAVALRIRADGSQSYEPVAVFDQAQNRFVARPIDLGPATDQVFLILFGTGLRGRSSLSTATALIGGENAEVLYVGPQGDFVGLDQVNVRLPRTLAGRGEVDLALTVDGRASNIVRASFAVASAARK